MRLRNIIQISQEVIDLDKLLSIQYEQCEDGEFFIVTFQTGDMKRYSILFRRNQDVLQVAYRFYVFFKENELKELLL